MRLTNRKILVLLAFLLAGKDAIGQQYPFTPVAGAPRAAQSLFQDSRSRLWIGGEDAAIFDGERFFRLRDLGLPKTTVYSFAEDSSDAVWIATADGLFHFDGAIEKVLDGFTTSVVALGTDSAISPVGEKAKGLPTRTKLIRVSRRSRAWETETIADLQTAGPFTVDLAGNVVYPLPGFGWGEFKLSDAAAWLPNRLFPAVRHPAAVAARTGDMRVLRDRFGCVWYAANSDVAYRCPGSSDWSRLSSLVSWVSAGFTDDFKGSLLFHGQNTLLVGRPGHFRLITLANGLPTVGVTLRGRDGTLWISASDGLYRSLSSFSLEFWSSKQGVESPWCFTRSGKRVYAGSGTHIAALNNDRSRWTPQAKFTSPDLVVSLTSLQDGTLVGALRRAGVVRIRQDGAVISTIQHVRAMRTAVAEEGSVWVGAANMSRLVIGPNRLSMEEHTFNSSGTGGVLDIQYEPATNKLWSCYGGGLVVKDAAGNWSEITARDGLLVNPCWSLAALPSGDVWYGYFTLGAFALVRPRKGGYTVHQYRAGGEIEDPESYVFDVDSRGWLWRGGANGISVADPAEAEAGQWLFLDLVDGLPAAGVNSGAFFADKDGSVWWGIDNFVCHYSPPLDLVHSAASPEVFLSAISWEGGGLGLRESLTKMPNGVKLTAHFGSLQFERRNSLRLRYRVLPDRIAWTETRNLDPDLGSLGWGTHRIEVQARIFGGPWSRSAVAAIRVARPAWLSTSWLVAYLCVGGATVMVVLIERKRRQTIAAFWPADLSSWRDSLAKPELLAMQGGWIEDRYEVGELIAEGGFANVVMGYDQIARRNCAIKFFREEISGTDNVIERFDLEIAAIKAISHPHVVGVYAHGILASGLPYLVMEFIDGRSLREALQDGPLKPKRIARILRQLADALHTLHSCGIYHRDLKPENVMLRRDGPMDDQAVLIDFSIAIIKTADESIHGLSRAGGTFDYMAPEQAVGFALEASDIYSLAKVVIEMMTGRRVRELFPKAGLRLAETIREFKGFESLGLGFEAIDNLTSALRFDPERRPANAVSFAEPIARDLETQD